MRFRPHALRLLLSLAGVGLATAATADEAGAADVMATPDEPRAAAIADDAGAADTTATPDPAVARLRELFIPGAGALRPPTSPRFASLLDPSAHGTRLIVGWLVPGLAVSENAALATVAALLGQQGDGRLPARLAAAGRGVEVSVSVGELRAVPLLSINVVSPRAGAAQELELAVLAAVSKLGADENAGIGAFVRRHLSPRARAVVEVHPPEHAVAGPRPKLYVAKRGDTLAKLARHFGVSEKALLDINRIEARHLSPGQKLVLPR